MKKLCSLIVSVVMLFSCLGAFAENANSTEYDEAIFNVKSIGLMQGYEDGEFYPEREISRAEFSAIASRLCGLTGDVGMSETVFWDVSSDSWASGYISVAYNLGIINGFEDGSFRPDDKLTHEQALKIIVCALGYEVQAKNYGGYPGGYYVVASNLGITKGVSKDIKTNALRGEVAVYLSNALDVHPLEAVISNEADKYEVSRETLYEKLTSYRDSEKLEGVITANGVTALDGETTLDADQIALDGKTYNAGNTNAADFLGQNVEIYVADADKKVPVVISVRALDDGNKVLTIPAENIEDIDLSGLTYYTDGEKTKDISFASTDYYIYNGKAVKKSELTDGFLKIATGEYKLLDSDGDKKYETIFITEYESFVVDRIYFAGKTVYFGNAETYKGKSGFKFMTDDDEYSYDITLADGSIASFDDITEGSVITLCASDDKKLCKAVISKETVEGSVTEISSKSDEVCIDGKLFSLALKESGEVKCPVSLGDSATFVLDCFCKIVSTDGQKLSGENYAYVTGSKGATFSGSAKIQVAKYGSYEKIVKKVDNTEEIYYEYRNGELEVLEFASKVNFNGQSTASSAIVPGELESNIIGYTLDGEGKIKKLTVYGNVLDKYPLLFNAEIMSFGGYTNAANFFVGNGTQVICVPTIADSVEDYYEIVKLTDGSSYSCLPVNIDEDTQTAEAVLIIAEMDADSEKAIDPDAEISIVGEVSTVINDEGVESVKLTLLTGDVVSEEICKDSASVINLAKSLGKGDLIKYSLNADGLIDKIDKKASIRGLKKYYNSNKNSPVEEIYGLAKSIKLSRLSPLKNEIVDEIEIMLGSDDDAPYYKYEIAKKDGPEIYVYERRSGNIYNATCDDIESYQDAGSGASEVFMLVNSNNPEVVVIIKK